MNTFLSKSSSPLAGNRFQPELSMDFGIKYITAKNKKYFSWNVI
jgi:hypothetical protein